MCVILKLLHIPAAALVCVTLVALPPHIIEGALGMFFIGMIPTRRWLASHNLKPRLWHLAVIPSDRHTVHAQYRGVHGAPTTRRSSCLTVWLRGAFLATEAAKFLGVMLQSG